MLHRVVDLAEGGTKLFNDHSDAVELQGDEDKHKEMHCSKAFAHEVLSAFVVCRCSKNWPGSSASLLKRWPAGRCISRTLET